MQTKDPIELIVADALTRANIRFVHESEQAGGQQTLDFFLPDSGVYIECKQFHSDRIAKQIANFPDVIVIQGRAAAEAFASMLRRPITIRERAPLPFVIEEEDDCSRSSAG